MRQLLFFVLLAVLNGVAAGCASGSDDTRGDDEEVGAIEHGETDGMCGGIAGFSCEDPDDFCDYKPGECKEIADAAGVCRKTPDVCTMQYDPVCGCDGKTYSNACIAATNRVSVAYRGTCERAAE